MHYSVFCIVITEDIRELKQRRFERRTSTGSEVFFILKHLDAPKFVFLSVLTIIETSCPKKWAKPLSKNEKKTTSGWRASLKNVFAEVHYYLFWKTACLLDNSLLDQLDSLHHTTAELR